MQHDAWFFVWALALIFLVWAAMGGPSHPISFSGPFLATPDTLGGGTYLSFPRAPFSIGTSQSSLSGGTSGSSGGVTATTTVQGVVFGTPSTYRGKVSVSHYISGAGSSSPGSEYLQISLSQNAAPVTISGWSLKSEASGNLATIPVGSDLPISGTINGGLPITLQPGQKAIIISGRSPIGASFRENKCIGYFAQFQKFYPSLPNTCPTPNTEYQTYYGPDYIRDSACISYVNKVSRCQAVLTPPVGVTSACSLFLTNHLNYNGCITTHQNDADFKGNTWRIYLDRTASMWRSSHEVVKVLDAEGKTVDSFSY